MEQHEIILKKLSKMNIEYELVEHPPALTTEDADRYIEGIEGVRTKTLFLCNKKSRNYYLLVMDDAKQVTMKKLEELLSEKGLHFCSPEKLMSKLHLFPGAVSLFGLLNNEEKDVKVLIDEEIFSESRVSFHVADNTRTAFISTSDMMRFIEEMGFSCQVISLPA